MRPTLSYFREHPTDLPIYLEGAKTKPFRCAWYSRFSGDEKICARVTFPETFKGVHMEASALRHLVTVMVNHAAEHEDEEEDPFHGIEMAQSARWSRSTLDVANARWVEYVTLLPHQPDATGGFLTGYKMRGDRDHLFSSVVGYRPSFRQRSGSYHGHYLHSFDAPVVRSYRFHPATFFVWAVEQFEPFLTSADRDCFLGLKRCFEQCVDLSRSELADRVRKNIHQSRKEQYHEGGLMLHLAHAHFATTRLWLTPEEEIRLKLTNWSVHHRFDPKANDQGRATIEQSFRRAFLKKAMASDKNMHINNEEEREALNEQREKLQLAKDILSMTSREFYEWAESGSNVFRHAWMTPSMQRSARYFDEMFAYASEKFDYVLRAMTAPDLKGSFAKRYDAEAEERAERSMSALKTSIALKDNLLSWTVHDLKRRHNVSDEHLYCHDRMYSSRLLYNFPVMVTKEDVDQFEEGVANIQSLIDRFYSPDAEVIADCVRRYEKAELSIDRRGKLTFELSFPAPALWYPAEDPLSRTPSREPYWTLEWLEEYFRVNGFDGQPLKDEDHRLRAEVLRESMSQVFRG